MKGDLISRSYLLEKLRDDMLGREIIERYNIDGFIEAFPEAKKTGEWHDVNDTSWSGGRYCRCSVCGFGYSYAAFFEPDRWHYCPHCGAEMDVNQEDMIDVTALLKEEKMRDLAELDKLERYLKDHGIQYERIDNERSWFADRLDRHQICVPCHGEGRQWDAICQEGSYGAEEGLLEIMGSIVSPSAGDSVEGWLTAEDVIRRIEGGTA